MEISECITVKVRFSEVDSLKMVWHGNYVKYLEDAREAFGLRRGIGYMTIFDNGFLAPVYDMHLRYTCPAGIDDDLQVKITWRPCDGAKLCFDYEITRPKDGALILTASSIQLFTDHNGEFYPYEPEFFREWKEKMAICAFSQVLPQDQR